MEINDELAEGDIGDRDSGLEVENMLFLEGNGRGMEGMVVEGRRCDAGLGGRRKRKLGNCARLRRSRKRRDRHDRRKWHGDLRNDQISEEFAGFLMS